MKSSSTGQKWDKMQSSTIISICLFATAYFANAQITGEPDVTTELPTIAPAIEKCITQFEAAVVAKNAANLHTAVVCLARNKYVTGYSNKGKVTVTLGVLNLAMVNISGAVTTADVKKWLTDLKAIKTITKAAQSGEKLTLGTLKLVAPAKSTVKTNVANLEKECKANNAAGIETAVNNLAMTGVVTGFSDTGSLKVTLGSLSESLVITDEKPTKVTTAELAALVKDVEKSCKLVTGAKLSGKVLKLGTLKQTA